jgi:threonine dehydratase
MNHCLDPTRADFEAAAEVVPLNSSAVPPYRWRLLRQRQGTDCWLKRENHTPVGAIRSRA